jgi:transposase
MAAPYSLDLRQRVVAAVAAGMSRPGAAMHYQVSHSSVIRWTRRQAETGSPAALPMGGKKPFALADEEAWIRDRIEEKPDRTRAAGGTEPARDRGQLLWCLAFS